MIRAATRQERGGRKRVCRQQQKPAGTVPQTETPERRILKALAEANTLLSQRQIRERAATRNKTVGAVLQRLVHEGRYSLAASQSENAAPAANASGPHIARFPVPAAHA